MYIKLFKTHYTYNEFITKCIQILLHLFEHVAVYYTALKKFYTPEKNSIFFLIKCSVSLWELLIKH